MAKTTIITTDDKEEKEEQVVVTKPSLTIDSGGLMNGADLDGDGHITEEEMAMHLEFKRRELEDADAMRDAQEEWHGLHYLVCYYIHLRLLSQLELV